MFLRLLRLRNNLLFVLFQILVNLRPMPCSFGATALRTESCFIFQVGVKLLGAIKIFKAIGRYGKLIRLKILQLDSPGKRFVKGYSRR